MKDITAKDPEVIVLRFTHVVFGVNSSPFLLNAVLPYYLSSFQDVDPEFVENIFKSVYVDDLVLRSTNTIAAYSLYCKARENVGRGVFA